MTPVDLEALRKSMGLTVRKFAALIGVCERTYRYWQSEDFKPSRMAMKRIEKIMIEASPFVEKKDNAK